MIIPSFELSDVVVTIIGGLISAVTWIISKSFEKVNKSKEDMLQEVTGELEALRETKGDLEVLKK